MVESIRRTGTVVIGGGQAGLAAGRELAARGLDYLILEASPRLGDSWRRRWDSLRLFTPAEHDGLPGLGFPAPRGTFPSKDEVATYLESYAGAQGLAVRLGTRVTGLSRVGDGWQIEAAPGSPAARNALAENVLANNVIVATGTNAAPRVPPFAADLDDGIPQLHSSEYRNPGQVPPGDVLVVGAGTSGSEIALELAGSHRVFIAGRPTVHVPDVFLQGAVGGLYWRFVNSVLTRDTPMGRKAAAGFEKRGAPLIRISMDRLDAVGVTRLPRVEGVARGRPVVAGGRRLGVAGVIWATGYRPELGWIDGLPLGSGGWPEQERGVVTGMPGLYFLGIPFQYALTSGLIGGVGRDAAYIADRIAAGATAGRVPDRVAKAGQARR
ncbi:MAG TPA: NAD(P)/FAD-dependent oxidoreductase [Cryobacterium sp.]|nr:NAD(P)/FAD-dependent oxidoreductase [Cryobacterium sp.]